MDGDRNSAWKPRWCIYCLQTTQHKAFCFVFKKWNTVNTANHCSRLVMLEVHHRKTAAIQPEDVLKTVFNESEWIFVYSSCVGNEENTYYCKRKLVSQIKHWELELIGPCVIYTLAWWRGITTKQISFTNRNFHVVSATITISIALYRKHNEMFQKKKVYPVKYAFLGYGLIGPHSSWTIPHMKLEVWRVGVWVFTSSFVLFLDLTWKFRQR